MWHVGGRKKCVIRVLGGKSLKEREHFKHLSLSAIKMKIIWKGVDWINLA
jgi:hypothetical protein